MADIPQDDAQAELTALREQLAADHDQWRSEVQACQDDYAALAKECRELREQLATVTRELDAYRQVDENVSRAYIVWHNSKQYYLCESLAAALDKKDKFGGCIYEPMGLSAARYVNRESGLIAERDAAVERAEKAEAERDRLQGVIAQHDLCHDLHGKVGPVEFAKGCEAEQRKLFGCAPHADDLRTVTEALNDCRNMLSKAHQRAIAAERAAAESAADVVRLKDVLRSTVTKCAPPLEALTMQIAANPYREMTADIQVQITEATNAVRAAAACLQSPSAASDTPERATSGTPGWRSMENFEEVEDITCPRCEGTGK